MFAMENEVQVFFKDFMKTNQKIAKHIPETVKTFMAMHEKITAPGALDKKHKELIAVGIAVATHCPACIYLHTQTAVQAGAGAQEILEAASVGVLMGGGPAFAHIPEILKTFDALGVKY
jgi:AhpD family alkylhydroperoxidase